MRPEQTSAQQTWDATYGAPNGYRFWPSEELVRSISRRRHVDRVLEVGCGNGANLQLLSTFARSVVGVDISSVALNAARVACRAANVELLHADVADRSSPMFIAGSFDGVVDCMTSQHFPLVDHRFVYRRYANALRPGGWFFLLHLDAETVSERIPARSDPKFDNVRVDLFPDVGFVSLPPAARLVADVEAVGFKVTEVRGLAREYASGEVAHYTIIDAEVE